MDFESAQALVDEINADPNVTRAAIRMGQLFSSRPDVRDALHSKEFAPGVRKGNPGPDGARMTRKLIERAQAAAADYVYGVQNPRRNPKDAAVAARGKWANNVQEAIRNDSYGKAVARYDLAEAVQVATGDGGAAFTSGIAKREQKIARVMGNLAPQLAGISQRIQSMAQDTPAARRARMNANLDAMIALGVSRKGGSGG